MKVVRGIFLVCIIGGFAALFFVLRPPQRLMERADHAEEIETGEDILVEGLRFSEWEEDRLEWTMDAASGRYYHDGERAEFESVKVTFSSPAGGKLVLWAERVEYDLKTKGLTAHGSIRGKSDQGYEFTTESLFYDGVKRTVRTDDQVRLAKDRLTIEGRGMTGSLATHRFRLLSEVRAVFAPKGPGVRGTVR